MVLMLKLLMDAGEDAAEDGPSSSSKVGSMARAFAAGRKSKNEVYTNPLGLIEEYKQKTSVELKVGEGGEYVWDIA